jgi:para-nitrobenzyl esterase
METVNANLQHHIPYMLGSNSDDMMTPFIFTMAKEWASLNPNPESYLWFFER